jgi:aryl-alcohol dehydrogenase-like predicted oxidoreductase
LEVNGQSNSQSIESLTFSLGGIRSREDVTKDKDLRHLNPMMSEQNIQKNIALVDRIGEMAKAKGISAGQLALAWILAQGDDIFSIPGTYKVYRVVENLGSLSVTLEPEEEKTLRELAKSAAGGIWEVKGAGYGFADTPAL